MAYLDTNTPCAVIRSLNGTPEGLRYVSVMTLGDVETYHNGLVLALPVQGTVTIEMCLASANEACNTHNRTLTLIFP